MLVSSFFKLKSDFVLSREETEILIALSKELGGTLNHLECSIKHFDQEINNNNGPKSSY